MADKKLGMKDRARLGAAAVTRADSTSIKERHLIGGKERVKQAARRARGQAGRPPIWPAGVPVERLHLKLPATIVKALRLLVVEQRRDISRIAAEPLARFTGVALDEFLEK